MIVNRELTSAYRIERHPESTAPIVIEFVDTDGDPYALTGEYTFTFAGRTRTGVVDGNTVTFTLSDEDKATFGGSALKYKVARTLSGVTAVPFQGELALTVTASTVASFNQPVLRVTVDESEQVIGGITVIAGPQGEPYTESEEFAALAAQIAADAAAATAAVGSIVVLVSENNDGTVTLAFGDGITITPGTEPSDYEYATLTFPN